MIEHQAVALYIIQSWLWWSLCCFSFLSCNYA